MERLLDRVQRAAVDQPSTVWTSRPSAWTASTVHDFTGVPSSRTVQAPQLVVSQPMWVPVSPSVCAQEVGEQQPRLDVGLAGLAVHLTVICRVTEAAPIVVSLIVVSSLTRRPTPRRPSARARRRPG